jgi:large subunit ribosomal protein L23
MKNNIMATPRTKKTKEKEVKPVEAKKEGDKAVFTGKMVLVKPRVTEKASFKAEMENVFVFEVTKDSNKKSISKAITELYKVTPIRVNIAKNPSKNVFIRGKRGVKTGVKKAYVFLKKGDKIEL